MHDELVISTAVAQEVQQIMRTPPAALCRLAKRTPVLHTDRNDLGERWAYV
jgi:DNA polymerase-1